MKKPASKHSNGKTPRRPASRKTAASDMNQATTDDFEREDMGIAPKE
jgi:hypothetical protein